MRLDGASLREIADALDVHHSTVRDFLSSYADEFRREDMATIKEQELAVLTKARAVVVRLLAAKRPDGMPELGPDMILKAIDRYLRISESKRKLLGVDEPDKFDGTMTVETEQEREIQELLREVKNQRRREGDGHAPQEP